MKKLTIVFSILFLIVSVVSAFSAGKLPVPDKNGDYVYATEHMVWKVVDPDPNGLNGRLSPKFPQNWEDPRSKWPVMNINQWPVVIKFQKGDRLIAIRGNRGVNIIKDTRGKPWLMVEYTELKPCFVRANSQFIKPVFN